MGNEIICLTRPFSPPSEYSASSSILFALVSFAVVPAQIIGQPDSISAKLFVNKLDYEAFNHRALEPLSVYRIQSLSPFSRVMSAIYDGQTPSFITRILAPNLRVPAPVSSKAVIQQGALPHQLMSNLNHLQQQAIRRILDQSEPSAHIVQGPPGTGKTSTLAVLMLTLLERQEVIVYTATTNVAAKGGLRKLLAITEGKDHSALFHHSDLVLLGNPDKLQLSLDPVSSSFCLRFRVERIASDLKRFTQDSIRLLQVLAFVPTAEEDKENMHNPWVQYKANLTDAISQFTKSIKAFWETWADCVPSAVRIPTVFPKNGAEIVLKSKQVYISGARLSKDGKHLQIKYNDVLKRLLAAFKGVSSKFTKSPELFHMGHSSFDDAPVLEFKNTLNELKAILAVDVNAVSKILCPGQRLDWTEIIMKAVKISFSTLSSAGVRPIQQYVLTRTPMVIVDEATQATESSTLIVLKSGIKGLVMVGDQKQLSATVFSHVCIDKGYERSLFERLIMNGYPSIMLLVQYRMHPSISRWPSAQFYDGKLQNGANVSAPHPLRNIISPLQIVDLPESREGKDRANYSRCNEMEADMVVAKVEELIKQVNALPKQTDKPTSVSIGIVTFYKAQRFLIADLLAASTAGLVEVGDELHFKDGLVTVSVNTVDGFQGQERDIILLSTVLADMNGRPTKFIGQPKRLNVALTRAKHALHIFTNVRCVSKSPLWRAFFKSCAKYLEHELPKAAKGKAKKKKDLVALMGSLAL